jgi:Zn-dependent oligopeptidase
MGFSTLTGNPLPDALIDNLIRSRSFGLGTKTQRSCFLSQLSLALFDERENKNPYQLAEQFWTSALPHSVWIENNHFYNSWVHLSDYGAKFYSYLWSRVFVCDAFAKIRDEGLLNPSVGAAYVKTILSKGGSEDPINC